MMRQIILTTLALLTTSCASGGPSYEGETPRHLTVVVQNHSVGSQTTVYVMLGASKRRLLDCESGQVCRKDLAAGTTRDVRALGELVLGYRLIGDRGRLSGTRAISAMDLTRARLTVSDHDGQTVLVPAG